MDKKNLIQFGSKALWENEAGILKNIGYPKNKYTIPGLLEWLQDLNWPGALISMEALIAIEGRLTANDYIKMNFSYFRKTLLPFGIAALIGAEEKLKTLISKAFPNQVVI
jgi:hypothetical protein